MNSEKSIETRRILVVDDEQSILNAVRRELTTLPLGRFHYAVETCADPVEALERAQLQSFDVVVSDYRMPGMNGLEFLKAFGKIQPDCGRVVLSGQTDFDALARMINETHIYRFIPKPWSSYFLKSTIAQAVEFRQANLENRRLAEVLREQGIEIPRAARNPVDHILVVDDDLPSANAVARALTQPSRLDELFRAIQADAGRPSVTVNSSSVSVQIVDSALHAMRIAEKIEFSCVIADYRMPVTDGAQFLMEFSEKHPDCACILMSGVANIEALVIALDLAHITAFIQKPWVDFELRAVVAQTLARRRVMHENKMLAEMCRARGGGASQ